MGRKIHPNATMDFRRGDQSRMKNARFEGTAFWTAERRRKSAKVQGKRGRLQVPETAEAGSVSGRMMRDLERSDNRGLSL